MRIFSFIIVVIAGLFLPLPVFVAVAFVYTLFWQSYELCVLAVCIDAQFGDTNIGVWYVYTLATMLILLSVVYLRPYLRFYA